MNNPPKPQVSKIRLVSGTLVFITGFLMPFLVPLVTKSSLTTAWKTTLSGALLIGIPELFFLINVAILGKDGYEYLKQKVFSYIKKYGPPEKVSRGRYRIGLIMFSTPLITAWLFPYFEHHLAFLNTFELYINIGGDAMFLSSFFVLGGEFWDKVRSLFIYKSLSTENKDNSKI